MSEIANLDRYIEQTTLPHYELHRRVYRAFIDAMLDEEGDIAVIMSRIRDLVNPSSSWFLWGELAREARRYPVDEYGHIFAYAVQFKNLNLFKMIANKYELGDVEYRYGPDLDTGITEITDDVNDYKTDQGFHTDMSDSGGSYPVICLLLDFAYVSGAGVDGYDTVWTRFIDSAPLVSLVKPCWAPYVALPRPNLVLSRYQLTGISSCSYSIIGYSKLDALSDDEVSEMFVSFYGEAGDDDITYTLERLDARRRRLTLYCRGCIEMCRLYSGKTGYDNFDFTFDWDSFGELAEIGEDGDKKYLCRVLVNLSADSSLDVFDI